MILLLMAIGVNTVAHAGPAKNQPTLIGALRQCDDEMVNMVLQRGGVDLKTNEAMGSAFGGLFYPNGEPGDPSSYINKCLSNVDKLLSAGVQLNRYADLDLLAGNGDVFDLLVSLVGSAGHEGAPSLDKERMANPNNVAVRGVRVLKIMEKHGHDFRKVIQPVFEGRSDGYFKKPAREDVNLLMRLSSNGRFQRYAGLVASKQNPFVISMMFFAWVLNETPVDAVNSRGKTALMFAAQNGNKPLSSDVISAASLIEFLLEKGADKNIKDKNGKTALDYALESGDLNAAKLLK